MLCTPIIFLINCRPAKGFDCLVQCFVVFCVVQYQTELELTKVRDLIHDSIYKWWCIDEPNLPHSPQACVDRLWLRSFCRWVSIHWAIAIIIAVAVTRATFYFEYVVAHRLCTTIFVRTKQPLSSFLYEVGHAILYFGRWVRSDTYLDDLIISWAVL